MVGVGDCVGVCVCVCVHACVSLTMHSEVGEGLYFALLVGGGTDVGA